MLLKETGVRGGSVGCGGRWCGSFERGLPNLVLRVGPLQLAAWSARV